MPVKIFIDNQYKKVDTVANLNRRMQEHYLQVLPGTVAFDDIDNCLKLFNGTGWIVYSNLTKEDSDKISEHLEENIPEVYPRPDEEKFQSFEDNLKL